MEPITCTNIKTMLFLYDQVHELINLINLINMVNGNFGLKLGQAEST